MEFKFLKTEVSDGVYIVKLSRGSANVMNLEMVCEIFDLIENLATNADCKGIIITGNGPFFTAGLDVKELYNYDRSTSETFWRSFVRMIEVIIRFPKPMITAINGHSPAGGCIIAICCDYRLMAKGDFRIGLNEVPVGIAVPEVIFDIYSNCIGNKNAYQFLLEGRLLNPDEALHFQLVDELCDSEQLMDRTMVKMKQYLRLGPETFSITKRNLRQGIIRKLENGFENNFKSTIEHWWSPEARNLLGKLVEKLNAK
jgi:enoyl-CoA hydratase/carnithine racemase